MRTMPMTRDDRRRELIAVAIRLVSSEGVQGMTIRKIAQKAGIPLSTVHYCFDSKDDLLLNMLESTAQDLASVRTNIEEKADSACAVSATLRDIVGDVSRDLTSWRAHLELSLWALRSGHRDLQRQAVRIRHQQVVGHLRQRMLSAEDEQKMDMLARGVLAVADGIVLRHSIFHDEIVLEESTAAACGAIAAALRVSA